MAYESHSPHVEICSSHSEFELSRNIFVPWAFQSVDYTRISAARPAAPYIQQTKMDLGALFDGSTPYPPPLATRQARPRNRTPAPTNVTPQGSTTYSHQWSNSQPFDFPPQPTNTNLPDASYRETSEFQSPNLFWPDCNDVGLTSPISANSPLDALTAFNTLVSGPDDGGLLMSPATPVQNPPPPRPGYLSDSSADAPPRLLTNSGGFINDIHELKSFHRGGFGSGPAISPCPNSGQRPQESPTRRRRLSHSATSATTTSQQPRDCSCPFEKCETSRAHISHIMNHLIQKHGFSREYLKSAQETSNKHKRECVIVHRESGSGFCNRCWDVFPNRDGVDNHINQSPICDNHQHWTKEKKRKILLDVRAAIQRPEENPPDLNSDASRSVVESGASTSTDFDHIGQHLYPSEDETSSVGSIPFTFDWVFGDVADFTDNDHHMFPPNAPEPYNDTNIITQCPIPGIFLNDDSSNLLLEWQNEGEGEGE